MLGDSLPDGRYWFTARIRINGERLPEVSAGSGNLVLPREPLPVSRTARSITLDARSEIGRDNAGQRVVPVSSILGAGLRRGRYHIAVVVQAEGRRIFLSAGAAEL